MQPERGPAHLRAKLLDQPHVGFSQPPRLDGRHSVSRSVLLAADLCMWSERRVPCLVSSHCGEGLCCSAAAPFAADMPAK